MKNTAEILEQYTRLVRKVAGQFRGSGIDRDDREQAARLGILLGLRKYDAEKGPLTAYLQVCARNEVIELCRGRYAMKASSRHARGILSNVRRLMSQAEARGLDATEARLHAAEVLGETIEDIDRILSLTSPASASELDNVADPADSAPDALNRPQAAEVLENALAPLTPRQARLIRGKYLEGRRSEDLAKCEGISKTYANKEIRKALAHMQDNLRGFSLTDLL